MLVWNGCARHRVKLEDGAVASEAVIDTDVAPPNGLTDLKRAPTALALCDGSVRTLDLKKISAKTLKDAINGNDGNPLGEDW